MDDEEILQLVIDGDLDPNDVEDFKDLDEDIQELIADGEIDMGDV
jgi:hypothetical protein